MPTTQNSAARPAGSRKHSKRPDRDAAEASQSPNPHLALIGVLSLLLLAYAPAPAGPVQSIAGPIPPPLLINREHPLEPIDFAPANLVDVDGHLLAPEAAAAYTDMVRDARAEGVTITTVSGYRPYTEQVGLHEHYAALYGPVEASRISAPPGHSEHQTGLAVDIGNPDRTCALQACFAGTPAGAWAAANAWEHGFIIRYPEGAEGITGYAYEPWHLRWIGTAAAADMKDRGVDVLEEYADFEN